MAQPAGSVEHPVWSDLDQVLTDLNANKDLWARTDIPERIRILSEIKDNLITVAQDWAEIAARKKLIPEGSPLVGEEWMSGPYALMSACNALTETLSQMEGKSFLSHIPLRELDNGQIAARVVPHSLWDRLLMSGVTAEVWMEPGVTRANLAAHTATSYDIPAPLRQGKVALVLGAGNIAAIAPLDCFQKLFVEHQVTVLKMNPVNDYLAEFLEVALKPLTDRGVFKIVCGGGDVGGYLCEHPLVEEIHITGAGATHDAIIWGPGAEGEKNKAAGTPRNNRRITSELGAVCPTIVVPGPWSNADLDFQAEQIATQKLHNSGFNCIACQMLILPGTWDKTDTFLSRIKTTMQNAPARQLYYPGADDRMSDFQGHSAAAQSFARQDSPACVVVPFSEHGDDWYENTEVFAPAMTTYRIEETDAESYLKKAIAYANENLHGTLGANILIHPRTLRQIGAKRFEAILTDFHYGCIAINGWSGLGFLLVQTPWGAFPGHRLDDVQSGIGFVHNSFMFDRPERTIVQAPFRPFPRNLLSGSMTLLPRPPWFVTNKRQDKIGALLTRFQYRPSFGKLPRIFLNALLG